MNSPPHSGFMLSSGVLQIRSFLRLIIYSNLVRHLGVISVLDIIYLVLSIKVAWRITIYIYIYICVCVCMCIYIYIYIELVTVLPPESEYSNREMATHSWYYIAVSKRSVFDSVLGKSFLEVYLVCSVYESSPTPPATGTANSYLINSILPNSREDNLFVGVINELLVGGDLKGYIKNIRIMNKFMTVEEIVRHKYHNYPGYTTHLLSYFKLDHTYLYLYIYIYI